MTFSSWESHTFSKYVLILSLPIKALGLQSCFAAKFKYVMGKEQGF